MPHDRPPPFPSTHGPVQPDGTWWFTTLEPMTWLASTRALPHNAGIIISGPTSTQIVESPLGDSGKRAHRRRSSGMPTAVMWFQCLCAMERGTSMLNRSI